MYTYTCTQRLSSRKGSAIEIFYTVSNLVPTIEEGSQVPWGNATGRPWGDPGFESWDTLRTHVYVPVIGHGQSWDGSRMGAYRRLLTLYLSILEEMNSF